LFSFLAEVLFSYKLAVTSSKYLHDTMLFTLLRSTMQFFESTPIGRILNRFSKDMNAVEFQLPISFKEFTYSVLDVLNNAIMISYSTPWFLAVLVPLTVFYILIQVKENLFLLALY